MELPIKSTLEKYLDLILDQFDENVNYQILKEGDQWKVDIKTDKPDLLIGEGGKVMSSLQHMLRVIVHQTHPEDKSHFLIDINEYRKNREKAALNVIPRVAENKVLNNGETIIITGLSSYERMQVHNILADIKGLQTNSFGKGSQRRLVISPTSQVGSQGLENAKVLTINQILESYEE